MNKNLKSILASMAVILALLGAGCASEASVASENLSTAADQFEIERRIIFFNGITDTYLLTIEGRCSITDEGNQLEVTCIVGDGKYKKHFLGLSDNVTYFVEQTKAEKVSAYNYKVIFRPETIVPDVDLDTSANPDEGD